LTTPHPLLHQALALAHACINLTSPNPRVGCVIASADGQVLGQGHTQRAGGAHAEVMALEDALRRGQSVVGATAYVTLEPCSHQGRTGPCCDALVRAGIARVVACGSDPNPLVAGQGFARLHAAGVAVEVLPAHDPLAQAARSLNIGFFSRMLRKTPWVRMKVAASLDGTTALPNGRSQWITSPEARTDGHAWRARACAVLTGVGTVLQDRPRLDVRLVPTPRQPQLVVVDSRLQTPLDAPLFDVAERKVTLYAATPLPGLAAALQARGASIVVQPGLGPDGHATGKVDLAAMLADLARREINELHVEAGHQLNGSLLRAGLVDELLVYLAPSLLGEGAPLAALGPLGALGEAVPLQFKSADQVGPDLRIVAGVAGRDAF
jgi:diaminohydroxyphosphoribosylaminopyrimidine deaminase/5-amino-6-(5-phosphoribosylamino)uracil reductase